MNYNERVREGQKNSGIEVEGWFYATGLIFLLGLSFLAYVPSFKAPFQFDDFRTILENRAVRIHSLHPRELLEASFQKGLDNRPVVNLSFALNYYFHKQNPLGYHIVNFFILIFTSIGIWLIVYRLLLSQGFEPVRSWLSGLITALIWSVHPVNVQAVTYIVQRYSSLAGALSVWSILFCHLALEKKRLRVLFYFASIIFCLLAILSKESALTLPLILLGYKIFFFDRLKTGWLKANLWAISLVLIFYIIGALFLFRSEMILRFMEEYENRYFTVWDRFYTEPKVLLWYALLIVFPFPQFLSFQHDFAIHGSLFSPVSTAFYFILLMGIAGLAIWKPRKWRWFSFAVFWYFSCVLIEALPLPIDLAQEHRLYLACLGLIAPGICSLLLSRKTAKTALPLVLIIIVLFSFFTFERNQVWASKISLWRDTVKKAPGTSRGWLNYCYYLAESGQCDAGIRACRMTLKFDPESEKARNSLGICYYETGKPELAEEQFILAVQANSKELWALFNLGNLYSLRGDYTNALKWYKMAEQRAPENPQAHYFLALTYRSLGNLDGFERELRNAILLDIEWVEPRIELSEYLIHRQRCKEALELIKNSPVKHSRLESLKKFCP